MPSWTFIGAGNMASSLIGGLIADGNSATQLTVFDINPAAREKLLSEHGVNSVTSLAEALKSDGVVIAVKPDTVESVCTDLAAHAASGSVAPLVVSVAAGVTESAMRSWLPDGTPVVRCMPNTPALLGLGATALFANDQCAAVHRDLAQSLLNSAGSTVWVDDEALLDAVTALSGSGPAYFFYLIEQMAQTGEAMGLTAATAQQLAIDTAFGAASMARSSEFPPAELRARVTSKGGTTAAAITEFEKQDMGKIVESAMQAAQTRAVELGKEFAASS